MLRFPLPVALFLLTSACWAGGSENSAASSEQGVPQEAKGVEASARPARARASDAAAESSQEPSATFAAPELLTAPAQDWLQFPGGHAPGPGGVYVAHLDASGEVVDVRVVRAGHPEVDALALSALRSWRFRPATRDGVAVESEYTLTININRK